MSSVDPRNIRKTAQKYTEYGVKLLSRMIKIPSVSGDEEKMARFLENEFRECGADEVLIDGFGNVMARLGNRGPVIVFDGHLDTVDMGAINLWSGDPFSGEARGGRVYGRGAVDQKGGLASMAVALRILREFSNDLPFTLFFMGTVQEEACEGLCWRYIINEEKIVPDMVILTEPTGGQINVGQRGRMEMIISVPGLSCHASTPELGDNAVYKAIPIISALKKLNDSLPDDHFLGKGSLAVTRFRSETPSLNAVPDSASIYLDRRLSGTETPKLAYEQVLSLPEVVSAGAYVTIPEYEQPSWRGTTYPALKTFPTWMLEIHHPQARNVMRYPEFLLDTNRGNEQLSWGSRFFSSLKAFPAWTLDNRHHLVDYAGRCHSRLFGANPEIGVWKFSTNGVVTKGIYNIPTFGYGPGDEKLAHAPNESVAIDDIIRCAQFYAYFPWIVVGR